MSIKDYNEHYIVVNGTTNEQIKVPKTGDSNSFVQISYMIDDILLFNTILEELTNSNSVTIFKSFMKDQK